MKCSQKLIGVAVLAGLAAAASGCGSQAYLVPQATSHQLAAGTFAVPPKVDLLLVEDDTGSMDVAGAQIKAQMPGFLNSLNAAGWDYHFATIPLVTDRPVSEVAASQYDSNFGGAWIPPFPGAQANLLENVTASVFRTSSTFDAYILGTLYQGGGEPGFQNMTTALTARVPGTGFLRPDALLAIFMVGNGNDTSQVNLCTRADGYQGPCELIGVPACTSGTLAQDYHPGYNNTCGTAQMSLGYYQNQFQALKTNPSQVKFFADVALTQNGYPNCQGGGSTIGSRYQEMAQNMGGESFDFCTQPVSSVLTSLASNLQTVQMGYRTRYLFIASEPNPSTISVTKNPGGNTGTPQVIPQDSNNGWTYDGYVTNVYTIDSPVPMNLASGYAIELHGSAKLIGADTADVTFTPAGTQNAASN